MATFGAASDLFACPACSCGARQDSRLHVVLCQCAGPKFCVVASVVCHVAHAVSILLQEHFRLLCRPDGKEDISHFSGSLDPDPQLQKYFKHVFADDWENNIPDRHLY